MSSSIDGRKQRGSRRQLPAVPSASASASTSAGASSSSATASPSTLRSKIEASQSRSSSALTPSSSYSSLSSSRSNSYGRLPSAAMSVRLSDREEGEDSSVTVAVRVRPFSERELLTSPSCCIHMDGQTTTISSASGQTHVFVYDYSFWSFDVSGDFVDQQQLYEKLAQPLLDCSFEGYNTCLFAYGQTGSGKSYSIMGEDKAVGVIPRFSEELFERIESLTDSETVYKLTVSFYEIYNEKIHDLLSAVKKKISLRVREHPVLGPYVEGLNQYVASSNTDIQKWIQLGTRVRATAATGMNDKSSRSHSVFTIILTQIQMLEGHEISKVSKINLIDLAGSERSTKAQTSGDRLREGASINRSLHTLGKVIAMLADSSTGRRKRVFVPYRDSVLTWLLKESLGGNSKTSMIATISPSLEHYEESLSTLRYAQQARSIINVAKINEDPKAKLIRELRQEIERLQRLLGGNPTSMEEVFSLREKLRDNEMLMDEHSRTWKERLADSEQRLQDESQKSQLSVKIDNRLPNLVNLNEDPQLSEMLLYMLKEGISSVGREESELEHDIELTGALIDGNHCVIENKGETVILTPIGEAKTFVNGEMVESSITLHHGDRVVFGGDHYFRFNHPKHVGRQSVTRRQSTSAVKHGFEFARDELFQVQNARLEAEIEEARMKANEEALAEIQAAKEEAQLLLNQQKTTFEDQLKDMAEKMEVNHSALEEHERGRQVDRDKIAELEVTKQSLEDELVAKKHFLYMHKLTTEKTEEERKAKQTHLIAELEAEKQKIEDDVAKLKLCKFQRDLERAKTSSKTKLSTAGATAPRWKDLMRIALLLQEANNISSKLNKYTTFQREDVVMDGQLVTKIRLHNTKLGITTVWSLSKFESRLEQMREVYEGEHKTDSEDLFYDPQDDWQKDLAVPATPSPVVSLRSMSRRTVSSPKLHELPSTVPKSLQELLTAQVNASPLSTVRRRLSTESMSTPLSEFGHSTMSSQLDNSTAGELSIKDVLRDVNPVPSICRTNVSAALSHLDDDAAVMLFKQRTLADRVLEQCQSVKIAATALLQSFDSRLASLKVPVYETNDVRSHCIQADVALEILVEQVVMWTTEQGEGNMDSRLSRELKAKLRDATRKVGVNVARLMQGMVNEIESIVHDSGSNVLEGITALAMEAGALAIATCKRVECGRQPQSRLQLKDEKVDDELKMAFRQGGERFVERRFQNARELVHVAGMHCKEFQSHAVTVPVDVLQCVQALVEAVTVLTDNASRFQMEYLSSADDEDSGSSYRNYRQIRGIVGEVSDIADAIHNMTKSCSESRVDKVLVSTKTIAECSVHLLDICRSRSSLPASSGAITLETCIRSVIRSTKAVSQGAKNLVSSSPMPSDTGSASATKLRHTVGTTTKPQRATSPVDISCDTS